ncbi:MAG: hypothetical protein J6M02_04035 [Clostridia bacterium]|nr:hypothetical protein [Clostridia bacterium]
MKEWQKNAVLIIGVALFVFLNAVNIFKIALVPFANVESTIYDLETLTEDVSVAYPTRIVSRYEELFYTLELKDSVNQCISLICTIIVIVLGYIFAKNKLLYGTILLTISAIEIILFNFAWKIFMP